MALSKVADIAFAVTERGAIPDAIVRAGIRNTMDTVSATSSGAIIQLVSAARGFPGVPEKSVSTLPGMMEQTRTLSWR